MPSPRHDALNKLVREHPHLPIRLLREIGGIDLPVGGRLSVGPGDLRDRISRELHADTVVFCGPLQDRWYSVIVEVETHMSEDKLRQTAVAANILWLETRKPVYVVFLTPDPDAARFTKAVQVGDGCVSVTITPVIAGPGEIPVLTSPEAMADDLLMAALSVMAHGHRREVTEAFVKLLGDLPVDDATSLFGYTIDMAGPEARRRLEETVSVYVPKHSPWAQNLYREGETAGFAKGETAGFAKGEAAGFAKGEAAGLAKGEAASVLMILRHRGIDVPPEREQQIKDCTDRDRLDLWLRRALDATHIDDLFDDTTEPQSSS